MAERFFARNVGAWIAIVSFDARKATFFWEITNTWRDPLTPVDLVFDGLRSRVDTENLYMA